MCPNSGRKLSKLLNDSEREREYAHDYMVLLLTQMFIPIQYHYCTVNCSLLRSEMRLGKCVSYSVGVISPQGDFRNEYSRASKNTLRKMLSSLKE